MTIKFKPTEDEVRELDLGKRVTIGIVGVMRSAKAQAVMVGNLGGILTATGVPHVTVSFAQGAKAIDSLKAFPIFPVVGAPRLSGRIALVDTNDKEHYSLASAFRDGVLTMR